MTFYYFPIAAGLKVPALPGDWRAHATTDEAQICKWLDAGLNLAVDCERSGIAVIDTDAGEVGEANLATLGPLPPTYEVKTPHGRHRYFVGALRPTVSKIAGKVDTRGIGSYVLVPPSVVPDGVYEAVNDRKLAALPGWVPAAVEAATPRSQVAAIVSELDLPGNVARGVAYLQALPPMVEHAVVNGGADAKTYEAACKLRELGVSAETSITLLLEHLKITPKDERFDAFITRKVDNAWEYAQNDPGAWGVAPLSETFGHLARDADDEDEGGDRPDPYHVLFEAEQTALQLPTYLMPDLIPDQSVVVMYGPPGSFKSFLALDIGLTLAAGLKGWGMPASAPRTVVYVAGEGPRSIARLRRPAWRAAHEITEEIPFGLVTNMPRAGDMPTVHAFVTSIKAQGLHPAVVFLDTWARFMSGLNESDPKEAQLGVDAMDYIKRSLKCSVFVVHHTGKDGVTYRGSNALEGGADAMHEVVPHKLTKAVAIHNRRQKDADERAEPWLFEGQEVLGSLVFQPISAEAHRKLTQADDALGSRAVASALVQCGALGAENAVTTHVLASKLRPQPAEEPPEATQAGVERVVRQLRAAARGRLESYCERRGQDIWWSMPGAT